MGAVHSWCFLWMCLYRNLPVMEDPVSVEESHLLHQHEDSKVEDHCLDGGKDFNVRDPSPFMKVEHEDGVEDEDNGLVEEDGVEEMDESLPVHWLVGAWLDLVLARQGRCQCEIHVGPGRCQGPEEEVGHQE